MNVERHTPCVIASRKGLISRDRAWQLVVMLNSSLILLVPMEMTITGEVAGIAFEGSDTIWVIDP